VKLIKTTEARRKGKLISHGNQLDLIQKNKQRVRSVSLAGCFSGKGITRRFPPKGMALCCCCLCNWGFRSGTKSHYHKISLSEKKVDIYEAQEGAAKQDESIAAHMGRGLPSAMGPGTGRAVGADDGHPVRRRRRRRKSREGRRIEPCWHQKETTV